MTREIDFKAAFLEGCAIRLGNVTQPLFMGKVWSLKEMTWGMDSWGRVMALFPVKNGPQYRSENQYRGGFIAAFAPWLPEEGKPRLLYKPYRGR